MARIVTLTLNPALDLSTSVAAVVDAHKLRCESPQVHPGGGGINVARVLHRLGADVLAMATAGGPTGERLSEKLAGEAVRCVWLPIAGETRESFTVHERQTGREFRFVLPGPALAEDEWQRCLSRIGSLPETPAYLVASGSLPPGVPLDFYARLARLARQAGSRLVLDASGEALRAALAEGVWGVKPSLGEMRALTGHALATLPEQLAAAQDLAVRGRADVVGLSLGAQGALMATRDEAVSARAVAVPVRGTVGAGDSFVAGWIAQWDLKPDLAEALRAAVATASAALMAAGTALSEAAEVARLKPQVQILRHP